MNGNFTLDSNILIYAFGNQSEEKKLIAKKILSECKSLSIQTINETVYILFKKYNYSTDKLDEIIQFFIDNFQIRELNTEILSKALELMQVYNYSFWDSMMLASAIIQDCRVIYSEDMQHNQTIEGKLTIINPFLK